MNHDDRCPCDECQERLYKKEHPYCPHGREWEEYCEQCLIARQEYMAWATTTGREPY